MIFTTGNNDNPTIHFVAITCQGSSIGTVPTTINVCCLFVDMVDSLKCK